MEEVIKRHLLLFAVLVLCIPLSSAPLSDEEETFFSSFGDALESRPHLHLTPDDLSSPEMTVVPEEGIYPLPKQTAVYEFLDVGFEPSLFFPAVEEVRLFRSDESIAAFADEERSLSGIVFRRFLNPIDFDDWVPEGMSHQATSRAIGNLKELARMISYLSPG